MRVIVSLIQHISYTEDTMSYTVTFTLTSGRIIEERSLPSIEALRRIVRSVIKQETMSSAYVTINDEPFLWTRTHGWATPYAPACNESDVARA